MANSNSVKSSAMYIGYLILKEIKEKNSEKVSIYDVSRILKKKGINSSRQLVLGLSFLYSVDIVEFEEANVWIKK
ncbi:ABC-three component system middle component 6 [Clostridium guangxiense]|uniref:ABC-three component system middle component 6 n=1 Tax=Clostridium guangxiense TaxID=1662055 RepID=UPI0038B2B68A